MHHCDFQKNLKDRDQQKRLADFLFEAAMLRRTPRTGFQFLGTSSDNVAEHSFGTAVTGYALALRAGADPAKTVLMCLFHDLHEARTGDFNYVSRRYNTCRRTEALEDCLAGTGMEQAVLPLWEELEADESLEARLAHDADQIDLMVKLREQEGLGNANATKWLESAMDRLRTEEGKALARMVRETDHTDWWFLGPDREWWGKGNGRKD